MALEGFTIGGSSAPAAAGSSSAAPATSGALKGFTIGASAAPAVKAPTTTAPVSSALKGYTPLLSPGENAFKTPTAPDTSGLFKNSVAMLDTSMSKIGQGEVSTDIPKDVAAPAKTAAAPSSVGSEFDNYQNPFAGPLAKIGVTVPTSIAQPGSNLESIIKAGKAAGDQLRSAIQKPLSAVANFTVKQAQSWMPQDPAYQNGTRKLNYGDVANLLPKMFIASGLPNAVLDLAEPVEEATTGQTGGAVNIPSFNNDPMQAQGVETDYEQRLAAGQSDSQAFWGSALNLGLDLSVLIPFARGIAKTGIAALTPESLLKTTQFNTRELRTFLQTGDAMPVELQQAFKELPDNQKSQLVRGLITEIKNPTPSVLGHILGVSNDEAAQIFKQLNMPVPQPKPLTLPKGSFDDVLTKEVKTALTKHSEPVVSEALQEQHGITAQYADQVITAVKGDLTPAETTAKVQSILANQMPELNGKEGEPVSGVDLKQFGKLSSEAVEPLAKTAAIRYQKEVIEPAKARGEATVLGGDNLKDHFGNDYNDLNHPVYSKAVNDILYPQALKENSEPYVALTGGGPASGKTELVTQDLLNKGFKGTVLDSNLSNYDGAVKQIELARRAGKEVHIYGVLPNINAARTFSIQRQGRTGRAISDATFARGHAGFPNVAARLLREGVVDADHMHILDTRNITDFKQAMSVAANSDYLQDPLAVLNELGYNEEEFKTLYGKENYDVTTGQRKEPIQISGSIGDSLVSDRADQGNANNSADESAVERIKKLLTSSQGGHVNPGLAAEQIANAIKNVQETIGEIQRARELTGDVRMAIYQHENLRKANRERLIQLMQRVGNVLEAQGWNDLYHHDENSLEKLSPIEQEVYEKVITPLKTALAETVRQYRSLGGVITPDLFFLSGDEYTPRFAKEKGGTIDKILEAGKDIKKFVGNGGLLSKSLGSVAKKRVYRSLTDEQGQRTVAAIKDGKVTAINGGKATELGTLKLKKNSDILDTQIRPMQQKIDLLQNEMKTLQSVKAGNTGIEGVLKNIQEKALSLDVPFLDMPDIRDNKAVAKDTKKLRGLMHDITLLSKVKDKEDIILRDQRIETLQKKLVEASNAMAEIENEFNPNSLNNKVFTGNDGKRYTIGQATTKEIEANTKTRYHTNVLANYAVALDRAQNALNAFKLLERIKDEKTFGDIIRKDDSDTAIPDGWKSVGDALPQFRGYHMEPRLAEALSDLARRQKGKFAVLIFDQINNLLISAIVVNPIMHVPNVLAGRVLSASTGGMSAKSFSNLRKAYTEVRNKGPLYLDYLEHGAPFMALKETTKGFTDAILNQYTEEIEKDPTQWEQIAKYTGYSSAKALGKGMNHINESITWGSNDIFFMHALMDYRDARGGSMEDAIKEVSKRMADYRIPERVLLPGQAGRAISLAMQSRVLMFAKFHYSGVLRPWIEAMKETAGPGSSAKERLDGVRAFTYLFLMGLLVYPALNKMWQGIAGSPTTYMSMAGPVKPIEVSEKLAQSGLEGIPNALQSTFSLSPAMRSAIELGFNVDLFNHNPIYGRLPAEGLSTYGSSVISPLAAASRMTPGDFALSLFGVWTPKNVESKNTLNQMKYDELPALQVQVKKDIVAGHQDKANAEMIEFNTRAIATWNQYQLETGGTQIVRTDEQKALFLAQWGIKEPGEKALTNASTAYGDGSLTSKSSLLDNVSTYAKAIGVDPAKAFSEMFSGQQILRVTNFGLFNPDSAIIVQRMALADSEKVRADRGADSSVVLDHVIPLEAGGTNDRSNLNLIPAANNQGEQHTFENLLGSAVNAGTISQSKVREYSIRYKVGQGETLPPEYMAEFANKYEGKTMTLDDVEKAIDSGESK